MIVDLNQPSISASKENLYDKEGNTYNLVSALAVASKSLFTHDFAKLNQTPKNKIFNGLVQNDIKVIFLIIRFFYLIVSKLICIVEFLFNRLSKFSSSYTNVIASFHLYFI